ncbi:MAG: hypothetical protein IJ802_05040 [Kiritimatiellae bacterium]|nr:hypothetical protein [Kiritimatiellia bacterium]
MKKAIIIAGGLAAWGVCAGFGMQEVPSMPKAAREGLKTFTQTVPLEVGNYEVSFTFGGGEATRNWVKFEGRRIALETIETAEGETKKAAFTARVKGPVANEKHTGKDGASLEAPFPYSLNLTVVTSSATAPAVEIKPDANARTIYLCGDSTVTDQQREPWGSWGQALPVFFKEGAAVANFARSGLTTASFLAQGRLDRICEHLAKDDVVVIQFGHNDQKNAKLAADGGYTERLNRYVARIREKGATPVLVTPVERLRFDAKTRKQEGKTLEEYANAVKAAGAALGVAVIDLNDASYRMYGALGYDGAPKLLCTFSEAEQKRDFFGENYTGRVRSLQDKTHHSIYGAYEMAHFIAGELARQVPQLAGTLREGVAALDPDRPDADPGIPPTGLVDTTRPEGDTGNKE